MQSSPRSLDKASPVPLYHQLTELIRAEIGQGDLKPGDLLGTEKEIGDQHRVSRATVRKALDDLARSGLVVRITGRGTFVAAPRLEVDLPHLVSFTEELHQRGIVPGAQLVAFGPVPCPPEAAAALGCDEGADVLHLRRLRTGDGTPMLVVDHFLAPIIRLRPEDLGQSLYETLERTLRTRLTEALHTLRAGLATQEEADLLGIRRGDPVLRFQRTTLTSEGQPVVFEQGTARTDRYEYSVRLFRR